MNDQVKSRQRVADHGEVFTAEREVKAMCDLVAQECDRIDSRFLEPACGDENFLAEVLSRKLAAVTAKYKKARSTGNGMPSLLYRACTAWISCRITARNAAAVYLPCGIRNTRRFAKERRTRRLAARQRSSSAAISSAETPCR